MAETGHRLHVRAQPPPGHEERGAGAPRNGHQDHLQPAGPADQSGQRAQHPDGRVPRRPGGYPGARHAAPGRRTRGGGLWPRRHGRGEPGRLHAGGRAQGRRDHRIRNPPGRLRHGHGQQPCAQGGNAGRVQGHAAGRAGQPAWRTQGHRGAQRRCGAVRGQCGAQHGGWHRSWRARPSNPARPKAKLQATCDQTLSGELSAPQMGTA